MSQLTEYLKSSKLYIKILLSIIFPIVILNIYYLMQSPTNDGPWPSHYEKTATVTLDNNIATINNFRRARYDNDGNITKVSWSQRKVNLDNLKNIWYGISVFASPGLAHTFLSFDFGDNDPVVISVEARMRADQNYHPITGALDNFHLIYVIADEQDIIGVRTHKRSEEVYFMPISVSLERSKKMFLDMISRANSLKNSPEFYNTFTSNCTNNIMQNTKIPAWQSYLDPRILLPGFSDRIAYEFGVLDQNYALESIREAAHLKDLNFSDDATDYSKKIRDNYYNNLANTLSEKLSEN